MNVISRPQFVLTRGDDDPIGAPYAIFYTIEDARRARAYAEKTLIDKDKFGEKWHIFHIRITAKEIELGA